MQNWAGNYTYQAATLERPTTVGELAAAVAAASHVHALGSRHCFNDIADSPGGVLLSLQDLNRVVRLDADARTTAGPSPTVTVEAGITYAQLNPVLHSAGFALANLASLPHVSIAGACATATHGSGEGNGGLATSVAAMEFVTPDGELRTVRRGDGDFAGAVVHLGALGVVARLTLDLVPTFDIAQFVYERVPMAGFVDHIDAIAASGYSVSGFTDWQTDSINQVWIKALAGRPHFDLTTIGGRAATRPMHPLEGRHGNVASEGSGAAACTQQLGVAGPWHDRLCHFRADFTPSSGEELQSEFFVDRQHAAAAIAAVSALRAEIDPILQVSEIRFIAADELWLSPCYQRPSLALHFTWRREPAMLAVLLPKIEAALAPFSARPHWGKVFAMDGEAIRSVVPKLSAFAALRRSWDPGGKFANPYLTRCGLDA